MKKRANLKLQFIQLNRGYGVLVMKHFIKAIKHLSIRQSLIFEIRPYAS